MKRIIVWTLTSFLFFGCSGNLRISNNENLDSGFRDTSTRESDMSDRADLKDSSSNPDLPNKNIAPIADFTFDPPFGAIPLKINFDAMKSSDSDGKIVSYSWSFGEEKKSGEKISHTFSEAGCIEVTLEVVDDDGATHSKSVQIVASSGSVDEANLSFSEEPLNSAIIARDVDKNIGFAKFKGKLDSPGVGRILAQVKSGATTISETEFPLCGGPPYSFDIDVPIPVELKEFDVHLILQRGEQEVELSRKTKLLAGDLFVLQGQSNAESGIYSSSHDENLSPYVRTISTPEGNWTAATESVVEWSIGQWPLRMAYLLSEKHKVPIGIINNANGGKPIEFFKRNDANPGDPTTNYGLLFNRLHDAKISTKIRAFLWYQGESDGANWEKHKTGFIELYKNWKQDFPGFERTYVTQLRTGCGSGGPVASNLNHSQEVQRKLADDFAEIFLMSTNALNGHDGCHYAYEEGYKDLGQRYADLLSRDLFGATFPTDVEPPNPKSVSIVDDKVIIELRNPASVLRFEDGAEVDFRFEGSDAKLSSGKIENNKVVLTFSGDISGATGLSYVGHQKQGFWIINERNIGLLSFWNFPFTR